jgi:hypothetical protein
LSSHSGAFCGSSHDDVGPPTIAQMLSVPAIAATYETEHWPASSVQHSRSGLLPGLSMSFGLPAAMYQRTRVFESVPIDGSPLGSATCAVTITVWPTVTTSTSGSMLTRVPGAAMDGAATVSARDHASATAAVAARTRRHIGGCGVRRFVSRRTDAISIPGIGMVSTASGAEAPATRDVIVTWGTARI